MDAPGHGQRPSPDRRARGALIGGRSGSQEAWRLGGAAIAAGWGWTSPAPVGAGLAVVGLAVAATAGVLDRRGPGESRVVVAGTGARGARNESHADVC